MKTLLCSPSGSVIQGVSITNAPALKYKAYLELLLEGAFILACGVTDLM